MAVALKPHEAFRVQVILQETVRKLHFLGRLMQNHKSTGQDDTTEMMGDEISRIIAEQRRLEQQYAGLVKRRENLTGIAYKSEYLQVKDEIKEVANALRENTKHLGRVLKDNPNLGDNMAKIERDRQQLIRHLEDLVGDLFSLNYHSFAYQVADSLHAHDLLAKKKHQEKEAATNAKQLQEDYEREKQEYVTEVKEAQTEIQRQREKLKEAKNYQAIRVEYEQKESSALIAAELRSLKDRETGKLEKIQKLRQRKQVEQQVHQRLSEYIDGKLEHITANSEQWKQKREVETHDLLGNINKMHDKKEQAKKFLDELNEEIEHEKQRQLDRERKEQEREDKLRQDREENERKTAACGVIAREFLKYKDVAGKGKKKKRGKKK